ncbi:MAG: paraquat-inducible protein A [Glomeribacter sp. 1016415]|uniref:Paraquat-inducible protein A n=1 Tax=Mycoavidus cysteinexigens TaxID=1553431 RepID=A0A2Z6EXK5_9BURK|nr:paraquat-inducible protein A [Mycoavidus cysteinexigens]MCX8566427.1 paraquat-inducible protein A [Glomeribacter sp. 1016415]BBE10147.1 paraquat-inducible protein A [Mycoavidus cysteinexigens]GAM53500.1 paraquat-inducible protein A [bacterium endosymbiont of Mortierella elongata FMR23-6]GLR00564.1 paraquat-inducible protein [Mycoavidus cysteinexigens]
MKRLSAKQAGLVACPICQHVHRYEPALSTHHHLHCMRCGHRLYLRKPNSLTRTWAFLSAAAILYLPANLLPVMRTQSPFGIRDDTIMSGIALFWANGSWALATLVFIASILVPLLKLAVLSLLVLSTQCKATWQLRQRTALYRLVERVGRWSMLDIFVIMLTVGLVKFSSFTVITAGPGALAFGAVVILSLLASRQFDPRLMWDNLDSID